MFGKVISDKERCDWTDNGIPDEYADYAIRRIMLIEKIQYNCLRRDEIDYIKLINVYKTRDPYNLFVQATGTFMLLLNDFIIQQKNCTQIVKELCKLLTKQSELEYKFNFISDNVYEIFDTKGVKRTFLYTVEFSEIEKMSYIRIKEIKRSDDSDKMVPLKYALGMTTDSKSDVEPFIKCLNFNNIEIQKGDFEHILMSNKNAKNELGY